MAVAPAGRRVFLHVGAPKTGTTYLQGVLWRSRRQLAAEGILFPGSRRDAHYQAALDLRGVAFAGHHDPVSNGAWEQLAAQARDWVGGTVVISHELLAASTEQHVRRAVETLQPAQVHVIYTARDLARQIPAVWQESVKNGHRLAFPAYRKRIQRPGRRGRASQVFWRSQDPVAVLERWTVAVPAERIHLVTVPPSGATPSLLWQRFCSVVGVEAGRFDAAVPRSNASLGLAEAELVRRLNECLEDRLDWPDYQEIVKHELSEVQLAARRSSPRAVLPNAYHAWVQERSQQVVSALAAAPYDVVGSLDDLVPSSQPGDGATDVVADRVLEVALDVLAAGIVDRAGGRHAPWRHRGRRLLRQARHAVRL